MLPRETELMLCTLVAEPFDRAGWIFEPKLDGLRVLCRFDGRKWSLISRNDKPQNSFFPEIVEALKRAVRKPAILDGEVVSLDQRRQSSFRLLQQRFHLTEKNEIAQRMKRFPAVVFLFDILYFDRRDVRDLELAKRTTLLKKSVRWSRTIRFTPAIREKGAGFLRQTCRQGGEGIVAKDLSSRYTGGRTGAWLKIKCSGRQEFVIGGFTDPRRSRVGFGALLIGYFDEDGKSFRYAGKVGTGFDNKLLRELRAKLDRIETKHSRFAPDKFTPRGANVHFVKPTLLCEIAYGEWTQNALLRQPRFEGLRADKPAKSVRRERAKHLRPAAR